MKYFIDTEFLEGTQKTLFGKTKPTIDLISIGIIAEDGREYYAISKDFNLKEAWNRYDIKKEWYSIDDSTQSTRDVKVYCVRDNVLKPIFDEWNKYSYHSFTYGNMKYCINCIGKTNKQIAEEIINFCAAEKSIFETDGLGQFAKAREDNPIKFYGYYSDYDWVVLCWLFGKMIDLPKGFPMYCIDLQQTLDERIKTYTSEKLSRETFPNCGHNVYEAMDYKKPLITMERCIKDHPNYPKQINEHNALSGAKWNFELYKFLQKL